MFTSKCQVLLYLLHDRAAATAARVAPGKGKPWAGQTHSAGSLSNTKTFYT